MRKWHTEKIQFIMCTHCTRENFDFLFIKHSIFDNFFFFFYYVNTDRSYA